jgi:cytochrome b561
VVFTVLFVAWVYRVSHWARDGKRLFPWLERSGRASLVKELAAFFTLRWKSIPVEGALSGTVHGLGVLMASFFAITGVVLYVLLQPANTVTPLIRQLMDVHQFLGPAMWTFLVGHGLMAVWHQATGEDSLLRMFWFR